MADSLPLWLARNARSWEGFYETSLCLVCGDWFCRGPFDFQQECRDGSDLAVEEFGAVVGRSVVPPGLGLSLA